MLQIIIAAILTLTAAIGGVAYAADASNPGDFLYGFDLAIEQVRQDLTANEAAEIELRLASAEERLIEAQSLFSEGDVANGLVALDGYGAQISTIAQLIGNAHGPDQEPLAALFEAAQSVHNDVLMSLLGITPDQANESIQRALEASSSQATSDPAGAPDDAGAPGDAGAPVDTPAGPPGGIPSGRP